ncbi:hypothetical protein [Bradyrhizobium japonicum]|uniref:hypothetical protein n=1 Tax=Bradyrhizobium japonicum TaxID=375 RepID=UPI0032214B31
MSAYPVVMINNTALPRRRSDNPHEESWHIYSGDVRIGTIGARAGVPVHADQWGWSIGFYPGMEPGTWLSGIAATRSRARGFRDRMVGATAEHSQQCLRRMAPRSGLAGRGCGQAGAGREARQRNPEHVDALRLRHHIRQLEAGGELPAPRKHHRRAGGQWDTPMKHTEERPDPEAAARKLVELAASVAPVQDGRIYIERINAPFLFKLKGSGSEFGAGLKHAIERGWLQMHESGTYVRLQGPGGLLTQ